MNTKNKVLSFTSCVPHHERGRGGSGGGRDLTIIIDDMRILKIYIIIYIENGQGLRL